MRVEVDLQNTLAERSYEHLPWAEWVEATLNSLGESAPCELTIRLVDRAESQALNATYRGHDYPTNVLSFPADLDLPLDIRLLGDLILCIPVVLSESTHQHKSLIAHLAHLTVHGTLHLHGYDHETDDEALEMETIEIGILEKLGYANPYLSEEDPPT